MPLYVIEHPKALLTKQQKERVCKEITHIHCTVTGALPALVNVVFHSTDDNVSTNVGNLLLQPFFASK